MKKVDFILHEGTMYLKARQFFQIFELLLNSKCEIFKEYDVGLMVHNNEVYLNSDDLILWFIQNLSNDQIEKLMDALK